MNTETLKLETLQSDLDKSPTLKAKVEQVSQFLDKKGYSYAFDPFTILVIISIIISVIRIIQECNRSRKIGYNRFKSPGLFGRRIVHKAVLAELAKHKSFKGYENKSFAPDLKRAYYEVSSSMNEDEFAQVTKELKIDFDD